MSSIKDNKDKQHLFSKKYFVVFNRPGKRKNNKFRINNKKTEISLRKNAKKKKLLFNLNFLSNPSKRCDSKNGQIKNFNDDTKVDVMGDKKRKIKNNFVDSHVETIKKVDKIMEKMEKRKGEKNRDSIKQNNFSFHNLLHKNTSIQDEHEHPEFLSTPPLKMNNISNISTNHSTEQSSEDLCNNNGTLLVSGPEEEIDKSHETSFFQDTDSSLVLLDEEDNKEKKKKVDTNKKQNKWLFTGISGFDELLEKGIPTGSNIIVAGGPGCGKTIFCLQTIYNRASSGEDCVFLSMEEQPDRLKMHMLEFGFNVEEIERTDEQIILRANGKGRISLKRLQPIRLARSIEALLEKASGTLPVDIDLVLDFIPEDFNTSLLTLDSISAIETAFSGTRRQYRIYIEQLFRYFEELGLTTFMITESSDAPHKFSATGVEEFLADGIIVFYNFQGVKQRTRGSEIFKLRGAAHSQKIVPVEITGKGIVVTTEKSCRDKLIG